MSPSNPKPNARRAGSMPDEAIGGSTKKKMQEAKREVAAKAREQAEASQHRLAEEADALSDAIDAAASNLDDQDREGLARYARDLSSNLAKAAGQLEDRSVDQLAGDAKRLARNNPALFMFGSIAVGFGLSRFFKASAERNHQDDDAAYQTGADRCADTLRDDDVSAGAAQQQSEGELADTYVGSTAPPSGERGEGL